MSEQSQTQVPGTEPAPPEWSQIAEAGGIRAWVHAELQRKGLIENVDTTTLSDSERKRFKARREEERRVRRILMAQAWTAYRRAHLVHLGVGIFYHDIPDVDRYDIAEPENRRRDNDVPNLPDAEALAKALDLPIPRLRWLAYHREVDTATHYQRWTVPKSDGRERLISAPKPDLKRAQRWIARNITEHLPVHGAAHGFLPGRSTVTNALVHAGAKVVIKFDIKDFYPTVTFPRVKGLFRNSGYTEQVAIVLALLCTEAPREEIVLRGKKHYVALGPRSLPQGAPTSPSITNALSLRLDCRLVGLARKLGLEYTRYADDLTFSWHKDEFAPVGRLIGAVERIVADEGFEIHPRKTRVMRAGRRQKVTGLVVNATGSEPPAGKKAGSKKSGGKKSSAALASAGDSDQTVRKAGTPERPGETARARVPRKIVRQLRAAIKNREDGKPGRGESLAHLRGMAAYVYMTDPVKGRAMLDRLARLQEPDDPAVHGPAQSAETSGAPRSEQADPTGGEQ